MRLRKERYWNALNAIRKRFPDHKGDPYKHVNDLMAGSSIPLLAVTLFAIREDVLGPLPELVELARNVQAFFKYDDYAEKWEDGIDSSHHVWETQAYGETTPTGSDRRADQEES